jgi:hypothetical protein
MEIGRETKAHASSPPEKSSLLIQPMEIRQPTIPAAEFCPLACLGGNARLRCSVLLAARLSLLSIPSVGLLSFAFLHGARCPRPAQHFWSCPVNYSTVYFQHTSACLQNARCAEDRVDVVGVIAKSTPVICVELSIVRARPNNEYSVLRGSQPPNLCSCSSTPRTRHRLVIPCRVSSAN